MTWDLFFTRLESLAIIFAAITVVFQARAFRIHQKQLVQRQNQTFVSSFNHFSNMYFELMSTLPKESEAVFTLRERQTWWYRYWDIVCAEMHFFARGYLDRMTFEMWMQELGANLTRCPHDIEEMGTYLESLEERREMMHGIDSDLYRFLGQLQEVAAIAAPGERRQTIRDAVADLAPEFSA